MTLSTTRSSSNNEESLSRVANDLEVASATVSTLINMAQKALADEDPGVATLIQVAERYVQDIAEVTRRLLELSRK